MTFNRRDLLATGLAAGTLPLLGATPSFGQGTTFKPEQGASLRMLRWAPFVKGDEDQWIANTKKFTEATGVEVRIDKESWEDIRPKAATAATAGSGPDIMMVWFDDPFQYPDKLLDVTDLATYLGGKYGGWYAGPESYGKRGDRFIDLPLAVIGNGICYRQSMIEAAGFKEVPKDTKGFLELAKALKYARELYQQFIPGTESWLDINNNRAFLAGDVSLTANGVSLYYSAKNDPKLADLGKDIKTVALPVGPVGKAIELAQTTECVIFKYTKFPNAAKAYLQFMYEKPQMDAWISASSAYCCPALKGFIDNPVWTSDPNHAAYKAASETLRPNGYAGPLGPGSAAAMADYIMVDMVAEAATGQRSPEDAAKRAEQRATRAYRNS